MSQAEAILHVTKHQSLSDHHLPIFCSPVWPPFWEKGISIYCIRKGASEFMDMFLIFDDNFGSVLLKDNVV